MELIVALIFTVIIMAAAISIERNQNRKVQDAWGNLAKEMGLNFDPEMNSMAGKVEGVGVYIHILVRGSGKNRTAFTVFSSAAADILPVGLVMTRQHLLLELGKAFGMEDIEVGDPAFDDHFVIKCPHREEAREFFANAPVRDALLMLAKQYETLGIKDGSVAFELRGRLSNDHQLKSGIRALVACLSQIRQTLEPDANPRPERLTLEPPEATEAAPAKPTPKPATEPDEEVSLDEKWAVPEDSKSDDDVLW